MQDRDVVDSVVFKVNESEYLKTFIQRMTAPAFCSRGLEVRGKMPIKYDCSETFACQRKFVEAREVRGKAGDWAGLYLKAMIKSPFLS